MSNARPASWFQNRTDKLRELPTNKLFDRRAEQQAIYQCSCGAVMCDMRTKFMVLAFGWKMAQRRKCFECGKSVDRSFIKVDDTNAPEVRLPVFKGNLEHRAGLWKMPKR